jgi:tetratricopeptide (TPR) repeat protein
MVKSGPLALSARREGNRLEFRVNDDEVVFFDLTPLAGTPADVFGVHWPAGVGLRSLRAASQTVPVKPSPSQRGDQLYEAGEYEKALAHYQEQALAAADPEVVREARCKAGLCQVRLRRLGDAVALFEPLAAAGQGRWSLLAACQLWLVRLEQNKVVETGPLRETLRAHYRPDELANYIPEYLKQRILAGVKVTPSTLFFANANQVQDLEERVALADLFGDANARCSARYGLFQAYLYWGQEDRALDLAREAEPLALVALKANGPSAVIINNYLGRGRAWLMRRGGKAREGLADLDRSAAEIAAVLRLWAGQDRKVEMGVAPLYLERARLLAALKEWEPAEKELDTLLKWMPDPVENYTVYAAAWLMKGFCREQRGATADAQKAWQEALYPSYLARLSAAARPESTVPGGLEAALLFNIAGSLTGRLSDAEANTLWDQRVAQLAGNAPGGQPAPGNPFMAQMSGLLRPTPAVLRGMWRTPAGKEWARQIVFLDLPPGKFEYTPVLAGVTEKLRQDAFGGETTAEQDQVIVDAARNCLDRFFEKKLSHPQVFQLALTWKGKTGAFGWAGVAPQLDPGLRGPLAYVFGHLYQRRQGARADVLMFFRTALKDAAAGSVLQRVAQREVARLQGK